MTSIKRSLSDRFREVPVTGPMTEMKALIISCNTSRKSSCEKSPV